MPYGGKLYYNPGLPEVRALRPGRRCSTPSAATTVDAVHWDDYFYPYPVAGEAFDDDDAYAQLRRGLPGPGRLAARQHRPAGAARWPRGISRPSRAVRFGISPFGVWRNADHRPARLGHPGRRQTYDDLYADTRKWVSEGWIDYVVPQLYWNIGFAAADYAKLRALVGADGRGARGVHLYVGEALYKAGDPAQPARLAGPGRTVPAPHARRAGTPQVRGHVFFSAKEVAADRDRRDGPGGRRPLPASAMPPR